LFASILKIKGNSAKLNADFITILLGGSGTGKTSTVFGLDLDNFRQTNENTNIWLVAPTDLQVKNLEKGVLESTGTSKITMQTNNKNHLFEQLGIKELVNQINNEISRITNPETTDSLVVLKDSFIVFTDEILNNK
jgi:hypothetical protein